MAQDHLLGQQAHVMDVGEETLDARVPVLVPRRGVKKARANEPDVELDTNIIGGLPVIVSSG